MSDTQFEYYDDTPDNNTNIYGNNWAAQTFTPDTNHNITSAKVKVYREGTPGTVTVGIYATSSSKPTGSALCSNTFNGNDLGTATAGAFVEITFASPASLTASTMYAIVVSAASGDGYNLVGWKRLDVASYANGAGLSSSDAGVSWTGESGSADLMFYEYGTTGTAYNLAVDVGAFTLTGITIGITKALKMAASVGSFTLTGIAVAIKKAYKIASVVGQFILTGNSAGLRRSAEWTNDTKNNVSATNDTKNNVSVTNETK